MNYRTAGINNIGNISLALFFVRGKQRIFQASDYFCRLFKIKQYGPDAILTHRPDAICEYNPAFINLWCRPTHDRHCADTVLRAARDNPIAVGNVD